MEKGKNSPKQGAFPRTQWSLVIAASNENEETRQALAQLCESYWYPIYAFLRRDRSEADAKDLTQGFFEGLLRRDGFANVTIENGKFRTFLLGSLKNFLKNQWRHDSAQRRGSGEQPVSIDHILAEELYSKEPADNTTPETLYEVRWAKTILQRAMTRLRSNYRRRGREEVLDSLIPFLVPQARTHSYEDVAESLDCSVGAARKAVFQIRMKLKECFQAEVFETVPSPDEVQDEISYLINIIGSDWPFEELVTS